MTTYANKVMQDIFNHLDTKVNKIVDVNNLKKLTGGGGDGRRPRYLGPRRT